MTSLSLVNDSDNDTDIVIIQEDDISNYNPEQVLPLSEKSIAEIHRWLQPTAYSDESGEYRKHIANHAPGTNAWVTTNPTYQEWLQSEETGILWIKGIPGSGKSVLTSHLIQQLTHRHPGTPVLYFFFRHIVDANHHPIALLRDWLSQLLSYSPPLQRRLETRMKAQPVDSLSMQNLWDELRSALTNLTKGAYCIVDALDEMGQGNEAFLRSLAELGYWKPKDVKVLITSRPLPTIETTLRAFKTLQIRLHELDVDKDIIMFVQQKLDSVRISGSDRQLILDAVPGRANGLFLFAKLAMDSFLEPGANITTVLKSLPTDLNVMYGGLLQRHAERSGVPEDVQRLVLQYATHASRPLRCLELADMVEIAHFSKNEANRDLQAAKVLIRTACGPLLEVMSDETIIVVHHSFTEYLIGTTRSEDFVGHPVFEHGATHAILALSCIAYLKDVWSTDSNEEVSQNLSDWIVMQRLQYPFLEYAATNWFWHFIKAETSQLHQKDLIDAINQFLGDARLRNTWLNIHWSLDINDIEVMTPLYIAARLGIGWYVKAILSNPNVDVDIMDRRGRTPLWWAASLGHASIVRQLIAAGANPDHDDHHNGLKPLHKAAVMNHAEVVKVLLEAKVDPLTKKTKEETSSGPRCGNSRPRRTLGDTALMYACREGHFETLDVFLSVLDDVENVKQALVWSINAGAAKLVQRIIQYPGVDINARINGITPLYMACTSMHPEAILVLLGAGADPNILSYVAKGEISFSLEQLGQKVEDLKPQHSPLHILCKLYFQFRGVTSKLAETLATAASYLIDAGANVNQKDDHGSTALHMCGTSTLLSRTLLDAGADANATDCDGDAPLHKEPDPAVISLLIEIGGADVNKRGKDGKTPLLCLLQRSKQWDAVHTLLDHEPDCTVVDKEKNGALHVLMMNMNSDSDITGIVQRLLEKGADPNARNADGKPPLHLRPDMGTKFMGILLAAGADVNARDRNGSPFIFRVISKRQGQHETRDVMAYLLEKGASLRHCDIQGRTILHEAIRPLEVAPYSPQQPDLQVLEYLMTLELDPHSVDSRGNNLLHELALLACTTMDSEPLGAWKFLLALGLDITQSNHSGRTPLHILASINTIQGYGATTVESYTATLDFVIQATKNSSLGTVDLFDHNGLAPIHIAATMSQATVYKLLKAGASPTTKGNDGLTPLHLAARSRKPNIIGIILDAIFLQQSQHSLPVPESVGKSEIKLGQGSWYRKTPADIPEGINAQDTAGGTALCYACRSGRPESVDLLLRAGADITLGKVFHACADFSSEEALWDYPRHEIDADEQLNSVGLTITDPSRPFPVDKWAFQYKVDLLRQTERIDEILEMLMDHPRSAQALNQISSREEYILLEKIFRQRDDYIATCLVPVLKKLGQSSPLYAQAHINQLQQSSIQSVTSSDLWKSMSQYDIFLSLMCRREYALVKEFCRNRADFFCTSNYTTRLFTSNYTIHDQDRIFILIHYGFSSLLRSIVFPHKEVEKYVPNDAVESETLLSRIKAHLTGNVENRRNGRTGPYILTAVRSELPNMDMLKLLIQDVVDESLVDETWVRGEVDKALFSAVEGQHWWQAALAVPYLLENSANLESRNGKGQTILHVALESLNSGLFGHGIIQALVEAGADVNAVDGEGRSCLSYAVNDMALVQLLAGKGAEVGLDTLFSAIDAGSNDTLQFLLLAGVNPNIPYVVRDADMDVSKSAGRRCRAPQRGLKFPERNGQDFINPYEEELYPLYYAATPDVPFLHERTRDSKEALTRTRVQLVKLVSTLMSHGADPLLTFSSKKSSDLADESTDKQVILHEIVRRSGLVWPVLDARRQDPNCRDFHGQTLLLAACISFYGPDTQLKDLGAPVEIGGQSILQYLLSIGADPRAKDTHGRNVLHCMMQERSGSYSTNAAGRIFLDSFLFMTTTYPDLVNEQDDVGKTPLYTAIEYIGHTAGAPLLLVEKAGANPSLTDEKGNSCLHVLAWEDMNDERMRKLLQALVRHGGDINHRNRNGETPLFWMVKSGRHFNYNYRISRGEEEDDCLAIYKYWIGIYQALGADIYARDNRGRNLLHFAAKNRSGFLLFKTLLGKGLDPLEEDEDHHTAVDVAAVYGNDQILALVKGKELKNHLIEGHPLVLIGWKNMY